MEEEVIKKEKNGGYLTGILGAIIGANISINMDVKILKRLFGIFLAIIAIHEIYTIVKSYKKA